MQASDIKVKSIPSQLVPLMLSQSMGVGSFWSIVCALGSLTKLRTREQ